MHSGFLLLYILQCTDEPMGRNMTALSYVFANQIHWRIITYPIQVATASAGTVAEIL